MAANFSDAITQLSEVFYTTSTGASGYDAAGRLVTHRVLHNDLAESSGTVGGPPFSTTFTHSYIGKDAWLEAGVSAVTSDPATYRDGSTASVFDAWGRRTTLTQTTPLPDYQTTLTHKRYFANDAQGGILSRRDGTIVNGVFKQDGSSSPGANFNPAPEFITAAQWSAMTDAQRTSWNGLGMNQHIAGVSDTHFSWRSIAAGATSAYLSAQASRKLDLPSRPVFGSNGAFGSTFVDGLVGGVVSAHVNRAFGVGGAVNYGAIAADAFGNALGSLWAESYVTQHQEARASASGNALGNAAVRGFQTDPPTSLSATPATGGVASLLAPIADGDGQFNVLDWTLSNGGPWFGEGAGAISSGQSYSSGRVHLGSSNLGIAHANLPLRSDGRGSALDLTDPLAHQVGDVIGAGLHVDSVGSWATERVVVRGERTAADRQRNWDYFSAWQYGFISGITPRADMTAQEVLNVRAQQSAWQKGASARLAPAYNQWKADAWNSITSQGHMTQNNARLYTDAEIAVHLRQDSSDAMLAYGKLTLVGISAPLIAASATATAILSAVSIGLGVDDIRKGNYVAGALEIAGGGLGAYAAINSMRVGTISENLFNADGLFARTAQSRRMSPNGVLALGTDANAADATVAVQPGEFSIVDWAGYPTGVPKPHGTFRLIDGAEYEAARDAANTANGAFRRQQGLIGKPVDVHEIKPVKFGGSPADPANKVVLSRDFHRQQITPWWNLLQRDLSNK